MENEKDTSTTTKAENDPAKKLIAHESKDDLDLDDLLDSALDDFNTLNLNKRSKEGGGGVEGLGLGLGLGLPDLSKKKAKQKPTKPHVSEALDKLRAHTQEAVKGLGSTEEPAIEDWVNQFQELAGSQDMESLMETMMQQLLSKEILHKPMKEIEEKYPQWLEEHRGSLPAEDYDRFSQQHQLIKSLNRVYEEDPANFNKIVDLMQKMQECGQPPADILNHIAPEFAAQLSPDMADAPPNCPVM